jgi:hypothetical protein
MSPDVRGLGTYQNLVEEVLNELLLQRSGCEQAVEISSEQLGDEIAGSFSVSSRMVALGLPTCPRGER